MISWWTRLSIILFCLLAVWFFTGCSTFGGSDDDLSEEEAEELLEAATEESEPVDVLYQRGIDAFREGNYDDATNAFEEVEQQHPYSIWANRAQIMAAYAAYRDESFDEAALILDRFVKLNPNNERTPYAYYLKALCYYDQIVDVGRDQNTTMQAREALRELIARFPNSEYARDARIKLELVEDHLAGKEMQIGRYYLDHGEYLAALNRFRVVVNEYQTTSHIAEALHRLVETWLLLGVKAEAQKYASVLGYNYPGSEWYRYSYDLLKGDVGDAPEPEDDSWFW
ncbi:MAG: outer membrane protein assembly factor BamD [Rickettsiales bacterium]|nr:outer membrane protein assembly factor BamD [Rickettsiales bacterium]